MNHFLEGRQEVVADMEWEGGFDPPGQVGPSPFTIPQQPDPLAPNGPPLTTQQQPGPLDLIGLPASPQQQPTNQRDMRWVGCKELLQYGYEIQCECCYKTLAEWDRNGLNRTTPRRMHRDGRWGWRCSSCGKASEHTIPLPHEEPQHDGEHEGKVEVVHRDLIILPSPVRFKYSYKSKKFQRIAFYVDITNRDRVPDNVKYENQPGYKGQRSKQAHHDGQGVPVEEDGTRELHSKVAGLEENVEDLYKSVQELQEGFEDLEHSFFSNGEDYAYEVIVEDILKDLPHPYGTVVGVSREWTISLDTSNSHRIGVIPAKPWHVSKLPANRTRDRMTSRVAIVGKVAVNVGQHKTHEEVEAAIARGDFVFSSGRNDGLGVLKPRHSNDSSNGAIHQLIGRPYRILRSNDPLVVGDGADETTSSVETSTLFAGADGNECNDVFVEVWVVDNDVLRILNQCLPRNSANAETVKFTVESYLEQHSIEVITAALEGKDDDDFIRQLRERLRLPEKRGAISRYRGVVERSWGVCRQPQRLKVMSGSLRSSGRCVLWGSKGVGKSDTAQQYKKECEVRAGLCQAADGGGGGDGGADGAGGGVSVGVVGSGRDGCGVEVYDVMWWLDGSSETATRRDLFELSKAFHDNALLERMEMAGDNDDKKVMELWKYILGKKLNCLFVVDDVVCLEDGDKAVSEVVKEWIKLLQPAVVPEAKHHFVFTTNSEEVAKCLCSKPEDRVHVEGLHDDDDAIAMLQNVFRAGGGEIIEGEVGLDEWRTIAVKQLERHPQTILIAGMVMNKHSQSCANAMQWYLSQLESDGQVAPDDRRKRRKKLTHVDTLMKNTMQTYKLALDRICCGDLAGSSSNVGDFQMLAQELLLRLCFVDPLAVSAKVLKSLCEECSSWSDLDGIVDDALETLSEVGLVTTWSNSGIHKTVKMHSLSRDVILRICSDNGVQLHNTVCGVCTSLTRLLKSSSDAHGGADIHECCCHERLLAHSISCLRQFTQKCDGVPVDATHQYLNHCIGSIRSLHNSSTALAQKRFHFAELIRLSQLWIHCLRLQRESPNCAREVEVDVLIGRSLHRIGKANHSRGSYDDALEYYNRSLAMRKKIYGDVDHREISATLNNIGLVHSSKGSYDKALEYFNRSLAMYKKIYGDVDHPDISATLNNIGLVHSSKGSYAEALESYNRCLAMYKKIYGDVDHPDITVTLHSIGYIYGSKGSYAEALEYYNRCLAMKKKIYGDVDHPDISATLHNIGSIYRSKGSYAEALEYYNRCLAMYKKMYGDVDHPDISATQHEIGYIYISKGSYDEALEYFNRSLAMRKKIYGDVDHPDISATLNNIGLVHKSKGSYDEALESYNRSLAMKKKIYGDVDHPDISATLNNIGSIYRSKGSYDEALEYFNRCLAMKKKIYGDVDHPDISATLHEIGLAHSSKGSYDEALESYNRCLAMKKKMYGDVDHPAISATLHNIGYIYRSKGSYDEALEYFNRSLAMDAKIYGDGGSVDMAIGLGSIGQTYHCMSDYDSALDWSHKALVMAMHSSHIDDYFNYAVDDIPIGVVRVVLTFGECSRSTRKFDVAEMYLKRSVYILESRGGDPVYLSRALHHMGCVSLSTHHYDGALCHFSKCLSIAKGLYGDGGYHPLISAVLNNIGVLQLLNGGAHPLDHFLNSLTSTRAFFGDGTHPYEAMTTFNVSVCHRVAGDEAGAEEWLGKWRALKGELCVEGGCAAAQTDVEVSIQDIPIDRSQLQLQHLQLLVFHG